MSSTNKRFKSNNVSMIITAVHQIIGHTMMMPFSARKDKTMILPILATTNPQTILATR